MNVNGKIFNAAIFDLDGTIIESNSVWEKLDIIMLEKRGINPTDEFVESLTAMSYEEAAEEFRNLGIDISTHEFISEINILAEYEYANNIKLKDGVKEYLELLKINNIKIGLATASTENLYIPVLRNNGIYDYFDVCVTTYDVGKGKEYPDIYFEAAKRLGVSSERCVVFEDIYKAINTASSAGMVTVGVYDWYSKSDKEKISLIADKYIQNFNELL